MNDLIHYLLHIDLWLLHKINSEWISSGATIFFSWITDFHKTTEFLYFVLPGICGLAIWRLRFRSFGFFGILVFALSFTDFLAGRVIKPAVGRLRPISLGAEITQRANIYGEFGFPSNHAANSFCAAVIFSYYFPRFSWFFFLWALLVTYSRPYVGAHYPLDCVAGAALGMLIGSLAVIVVRRIEFLRKEDAKP